MNRSFTRRQLEQFSLDDDDDDVGDGADVEGMDESMEIDEMEDDDADIPSPAKRTKKINKKEKDSPAKNKKMGLKVCL